MKNSPKIPDEYWDKYQNRWDSHRFFDTIDHWHVSDYSQSKMCEVIIVQCKDGRFFIEYVWSDAADAKALPGVFNPFERCSFPVFFSDFGSINEAAAKVVASVTGSDYKEIMIEE